MKGDPSPTWLRKYQEDDEEESVTKSAIKELEIFVSETFYKFFPFIIIFFFYHFFLHFFYPRNLSTPMHIHTHDPHPRPTTSTHYPRPTTFSYTRFSGAAYPIHEYRVSQKFVPLITRDIIFDRRYTYSRNFLKMFIALPSTYIRKVNIRHALLCLLS